MPWCAKYWPGSGEHGTGSGSILAFWRKSVIGVVLLLIWHLNHASARTRTQPCQNQDGISLVLGALTQYRPGYGTLCHVTELVNRLIMWEGLPPKQSFKVKWWQYEVIIPNVVPIMGHNQSDAASTGPTPATWSLACLEDTDTIS